MKLSTLVKIGELKIFRYRTTSTNFLCTCARQNSFPVIENLVSLDYTDQYLRLNMVKNRPTISLDVIKDINKYILKYFPELRMLKLTHTFGYLV